MVCDDHELASCCKFLVSEHGWVNHMGEFANGRNGVLFCLSVAAKLTPLGCSSPAYSIPHDTTEGIPSAGGTYGAPRQLSENGLYASSGSSQAWGQGGFGDVATKPPSTDAAGGTEMISAARRERGGAADCNDSGVDGAEVDLDTDPLHCGSCDVRCSAANGTATCNQGQCEIACASNYADCDGVLTNGCETQLATDTQHCGACHAACADAVHGSSLCRAGHCELSTCTAPFGNCDGNSSNGCESNAETDAMNCGGCGNVCNLPHAESICNQRFCAVAKCEAGWADCNGLAKDGCETHLLSSLTDCGVCQAACAPAGGAGVCVRGTCSVDSCEQGMADCNQVPTDGCEVNLGSSVENCGGCGLACSSDHGTPSCQSGTCSIECSSGYGDCDGLVANGCETETSSNVQHCGGCNLPCEGKCISGECIKTPCSGLCDDPQVFVVGAGTISGISLKVCHESYDATRAFTSGNCGEFATGHRLHINGTAISCRYPWDFTADTRPKARNGGYCFHDDKSGANGDYAWFNTW